MPRKTKRAKQCAQMVSKKQKVEGGEISTCNEDRACDSSLSKSAVQKTNVTSVLCSTGPVTTTNVEDKRPTYADILSGRARPVNSQETHVQMNGKESVLTSVEHIFSALSNEYSTSTSALNHDTCDMAAQSTSNVADACKHLTAPCKEMHTQM